MAEELELVKISELPEASNVTATDVFPVVQNSVTKKVTAPIIRKYVVDSLGSAAKASTSDFEPSGSVLEVDLKSQARADEQNKRIDRIEVAAYLLRNNKVFKAYRTKALMLADVANIPANSLIQVVNDPDNDLETNNINGQYHYDGTDFLKLPDGFLDLINEKAEEALKNSKLYTDSKVSAAQQIAADDASTKASVAKNDAIHTAGLDAQIKADEAESAAIAAAAVDASAKIQRVENNDVNLLVAVQQLVELLSHLSNDADDQQTTDSNLLVSIQILAKSIFNVRESIGDEDAQLNKLLAAQSIAQELYKLNNFDPDNVYTDTVETSKNKVYADILDFPYPTSLIKINFKTTANLPDVKGNVISGEASITVDSTTVKTFATIEVQGSSSQYYPKKNWTLKLYKESTLTTEVGIKIGNVPYHTDWIFKANYVDASHVRNILSNRLWQNIVDSRKGYPKLEIDRYYVGKTGTNAIYTNAIGRVEGYPCVFNVNGEFYGIGSFNIGKKYFNYNLDRSNAKNILIDWGGSQSDLTKLSTNYVDTNIFELKSPKKVTTTTINYLADWDAFAASAQADFTANANNHLLEINVVDYWLFSDLLYNYDGLGKNFQFVSQGDGIFLFMPYDLDSVFGSNYSGDGTISATTVLTKDDLPAATKNFWNKVKVTYANQLKTRYAELRNNGVFTLDNIYELSMELLNKYPKKVVIAEQEKWTAIPSLSYSNLPQIMSWTAARLAYLDNQYSYMA